MIIQDTADGEFSVVKTALHRYMIRSDVNSPSYIEVKDSATLQQFGQRHLSSPGSRSNLDSRDFIDLLPDEILARKESMSQAKTIAGISTKFEYVCKVKN